MLFSMTTTFISYVPQIVRMLRTKRSEDLSVWSWILWVSESVAYLWYAILVGGVTFIIEEALSTVFIVITLVLCIYYRYRRPNTKSNELK